MLSHGVYTTPHIVALLNEVSASVGYLKTCLCTGTTKTPRLNLPSLLKGVPETETQCNKVPLLAIQCLPTNWLDDIDIPNTKWSSKAFPLNSHDWKQSYISAESFLYNKHGMPLPYKSRLSPFYCQKMETKRKSFIYNMQRRYKSMYYSEGHILSLEKIANKNVNSPAAQEGYLKSIVNEDPQYVIKRYESGQYARSEEIDYIYMKALLLTDQQWKALLLSDQLTSSEALRKFSGNKGATNNARSSGSSNSNSNKNITNNTATNNESWGTEKQPLYVKMAEKKGWLKYEMFKFLIFSGLCVVGLYMVTRGVQSQLIQKEILPDQSEKKVKFEDVQGCDEAKEELQEVVQFLQNPEKFERLGAKLPGGVLLIGPPGTGKTLLARAIAGEADVPFFFVSGSEFDEMFVGVGAARVRKLFASAKDHAPCIIFIDELDAIGGTRAVGNHQPYSRMTLNQLLVELDGFDQTEGVIVIGATNFSEILDKALTRPGRFDSKVHVTIPDVRGRINILKLYLNKSHCADDVDAEVIARGTPGFSGADLSNLVNQAALRAASLQLPLITMEHFEWARDKITMGPERKSAVIAKQNQILTAYHESGHAIVAIYTKDAQPVHKATIMPRGNALGYVMQLPEKDELSLSRKQLLARMDVCMGGRVAEEMIFGEDSITTGASSDLQQASKVARAMVTKYGMSDKVGTVLIDEQEDKISPELQHNIESEVKRLIQEAYDRAKSILYKHSKEHKMLAEGLLKYETLNSKEIDLVLKGLPLPSK